MDKGYLLPEEPETDETVCYKVTVPDRPEYRLAFEGQIVELGYWFTWEKNAEKTGRIAARLFRETLEGMCMAQTCAAPIATIPFITATESASNVITAMSDIITVIIDSLGEDISDVERIKLTGTIITPIMPGRDVTAICKNLVAYVKDLSQAQRDEWPKEVFLKDFYEELGCEVESDGHFLDIAAEALADWLNASADWVAETLSIMAAEMTGTDWTRASNMAGDGSGGYWGGPNDCVWTQVASIVLPGIKGTFTSFGYETLVGVMYAVEITDIVVFNVGGNCEIDALYRLPGNCGPLAGPVWNVAFDGVSFPLPNKPVNPAAEYWAEGATGDGATWGAKVQDTAYGDNSGQFTATLYELS